MAQLKDTLVDGVLEVNSDITMNTYETAINGINPDGNLRRMLTMSSAGNTVLGSGGYEFGDGNTNIYGNRVKLFIGEAGKTGYVPYYHAGDTIDYELITSGYVSSAKSKVFFNIPLSKPIIGSPTITITSNAGFVLRQNNSYTHGSEANSQVAPDSYNVVNVGADYISVSATFSNTTNAENNSATGIAWYGRVVLS